MLVTPLRAWSTLLVAVLLLTGLPAAASAASTSARLALSPSSGPVGTTTAVSISGFPRATAVTVTLASATVRTRTDRSGTAQTRLTVPAGAAGRILVRATAGTTSASAPFDVTVPVPAPAPPAASTAVRFGITTPGGPRAAAELDDVTRLVGEAPSIVMWYRGFGQELDLAELDAVAARGAQPLITWEPYDWTKGPEQPAYALSRITAGDHDPYVRRWAEGLRRHGQPVMLRFAHEMNGDWYPWSEARNGNRKGDYVAAWRHVHDIFTSVGATNVSWVWSPNVSYAGSLPMAGLYPGHGYVDLVALDGYNWGTEFSGTTWQSPSQVFGPSLAEVRALAPGKPVVIAETASTEVGGSKAQWVRDLFTWMSAQPDLHAFVWFHHDKESDWRISSSATATKAFAEGLAQRG